VCGSTSKRELIVALDKSLPDLYDSSSSHRLHPIALLRKAIRGMDQVGQLQYKDHEIRILKYVLTDLV
jgi:hypothetical protein